MPLSDGDRQTEFDVFFTTTQVSIQKVLKKPPIQAAPSLVTPTEFLFASPTIYEAFATLIAAVIEARAPKPNTGPKHRRTWYHLALVCHTLETSIGPWVVQRLRTTRAEPNTGPAVASK
jgi:hypothetical protein